MARRLLLGPLLSAVLLVAGCGGSNEGDRQEVVNSVKGVYNALADKDAKKVCASISEKGRKEIETATAQGGRKKQSCEQVFNLALAYGGSSLDEAKDVDVTDVKIDGDRARATIAVQNRKSQVALVKEDGAWKLGELDLTGG